MDHFEGKAHAKINLSLDVVGRLENGYHQVRMIMQTLELCDELSFERTDGEILITCDGAELSLGEDNLIYRAIALMQREYGIKGGARVHLKKRIPIAAGMAGGSADAALTLKAMNRLYELGLTQERLRELGVRLGADVPYCIMGGSALSEGIGEILTRIAPMPECTILLAKPEEGVSTKYVYETLDSREIPVHPDVDGMRRAMEDGDVRAMAAKLGNVLETVTMEKLSEIGQIKVLMRSGGALGSLMSGSGPTVFGLYEDRAKAEADAERILEGKLASGVFVTKPWNGEEA